MCIGAGLTFSHPEKLKEISSIRKSDIRAKEY
jgi:hypothetical protein